MKITGFLKHLPAYQVLIYTLVVLIFLFTIVPFCWLIISSISIKTELLSVPPHWIPKNPTLRSYKEILFGGTRTTRAARYFKQAVGNSIIVAGSATVLCLVIGSIASYSFTRLRFRGRHSLLLMILATQMIPAVAIIIPIYVVMMTLRLLDTHLGLFITYSSFVLPLMIWIMMGYFQTIPIDIEDAARIDGCSRLGTLVRIVLPLAAPGLAATGIFAFIVAWNEFFLALILTQAAAKTLPVLVSEFSTKFGADYVMMSTGGVLASLPPVILALTFQKYIVKGLTGGAIKG
ncbi:carbohydrate ABC transporter permease [Candidatus Aerophobetes bacterium]|nr:carbohydrate ABC transporter permease [Candidatus Aerophobetes bacterium]TET95600.1 MAG: carbohydrate ABC transporter permease [Desulfobacteraceae bacterium]